jgi:hypothetical protein
VRALGFRESAFERRFGSDRYRWMNRLGNSAILNGEQYGHLIDGTAVHDLLDLAVEMAAKNRRIIYFCSCVSPTDGCHRHWVAPELMKVAKKRKQPVTTVEWPGYENEPGNPPALKVDQKLYDALEAGARKSVPLGSERPEIPLLALPWWTPVQLSTPEASGFMLTGPAQHRAGGWQLEFLRGAGDGADAIKFIRRARKALNVLPRSWPAESPSQEPHKWEPT